MDCSDARGAGAGSGVAVQVERARRATMQCRRKLLAIIKNEKLPATQFLVRLFNRHVRTCIVEIRLAKSTKLASQQPINARANHFCP
jgi:hypothetical protein